VDGIAAAPVIGNIAYVTQLLALARELLGAAQRPDLPAIPRLIMRLRQWVEDVRLMGIDDRLARAVHAQLERLAAAFAVPTVLGDVAAVVADELARLAREPGPPPTKGRQAFWK
jgi:hypothetical protein